jgi:Uma2 family endonuclease
MSEATVEQKLITGEELADLVGVELCELIDGVMLPMSPTGDAHGAFELNVGVELREFTRAQQIGKVRVGEVGIYIRRNPDTIRAADVIFISNERYAQKGRSTFLDVAPDLVVEIMSPTDSFADVQRKLLDYFSIGVRQIWVLLPDIRTVYAYSAPTELRAFGPDTTLTAPDVLPGFAVPVARLFEL